MKGERWGHGGSSEVDRALDVSVVESHSRVRGW